MGNKLECSVCLSFSGLIGDRKGLPTPAVLHVHRRPASLGTPSTPPHPARPFRLPQMPSYVGVLGGVMTAPVGCVVYVRYSAVEITVSNAVLSPWLLRSIFI